MKFILTNFIELRPGFMRGDNDVFEISSQEGTTQGCPLSMAFYALSLAPLVMRVSGLSKQVWYADDATGCDNVESWFDLLLETGPLDGYFPKPSKCILVAKPKLCLRVLTLSFRMKEPKIPVLS